MDNYTKECINGTKKLIDNYIEDKLDYNGYLEYSKSYFWTNEDIKTEYNYLDLENIYKVLCVLSSGDHIFNLIEKDILDIDTFDTNKLTEYYALGFKKSLILRYSYDDFKIIMDNIRRGKYDIEDINDILNTLYNYMDDKYVYYWKNIINYTYKQEKDNNKKIDLFECITRKKNTVTTDLLLGNSYLDNEENYDRLRFNLDNSNITFNKCDAFDLYYTFNNNKYDLIVLSNILDYFCERCGYDWKYKKLKKYENEIKGLLNDNGIILLHYFFNYFCENKNIILSSNVKRKDFKNEIVIPFCNCYKKESGIVLVKK